MFKIWAKVIRDHKIIKDYLYHSADKYDPDNFLFYLEEICGELDIPTPVILKNHIFNYGRFNIAKFRPADFVEHVEFDSFQLENAGD